MRRVALVLAAMALALLLASGVAPAANEVSTEGGNKKGCTEEGVTKVGTNGPDTLKGTNKDDKLVGLRGDDELYSLRGCDTLLGGPGKDFVFGGNERFREQGGNKNLEGGPGNDIVIGGTGSDNVLGDAGNDFLIDGPTREFSLDKLSGGDGTDVFLVENVPAVKDIVTCGDGFDRVLADRKDVVAPNCEKVRIVHGSLEEVLQQEEEFLGSIPPSFFEGLRFPE